MCVCVSFSLSMSSFWRDPVYVYIYIYAVHGTLRLYICVYSSLLLLLRRPCAVDGTLTKFSYSPFPSSNLSFHSPLPLPPPPPPPPPTHTHTHTHTCSLTHTHKHTHIFSLCFATIKFLILSVLWPCSFKQQNVSHAQLFFQNWCLLFHRDEPGVW